MPFSHGIRISAYIRQRILAKHSHDSTLFSRITVDNASQYRGFLSRSSIDMQKEMPLNLPRDKIHAERKPEKEEEENKLNPTETNGSIVE